jgi:hypothetical protein
MQRVIQTGLWTIVASAVEVLDRPSEWVARCSIRKGDTEAVFHDINGWRYASAAEALEAARHCGELAIAEKTLG